MTRSLTDLICWVDRFSATEAGYISAVGVSEHFFFPLHYFQFQLTEVLRCHHFCDLSSVVVTHAKSEKKKNNLRLRLQTTTGPIEA